MLKRQKSWLGVEILEIGKFPFRLLAINLSIASFEVEVLEA